MNNVYSARSILQSLGVGEGEATLALQQQIQLSPRDSDPDAIGTIIIVKAVQNGANQLGCPVAINGRLDKATIGCIRRAVGPNWESATWLEITKAIIILRHSGLKIPPAPFDDGLGAATFGGQTGALLLVAGMAFMYFKYK
jgi:hypothetical protein